MVSAHPQYLLDREISAAAAAAAAVAAVAADWII